MLWRLPPRALAPTIHRGRVLIIVSESRTTTTTSSSRRMLSSEAAGSDSPRLRLFKGVARQHAAFADALHGRCGTPLAAEPPSSTADLLRAIDDAQQHNDGSLRSESPFVSWTRERSVAELHAEPDGVVLEALLGPPQQRLHWSPDIWNEREVLVEGVVEGATVHQVTVPAASSSNGTT